MNRFPLSIDLNGKNVFLLGKGEQIRQKTEKMLPFGANLVYLDSFTEAEAEKNPALVIAGDLPQEEAQQIYQLCCAHRIPVNVVDVPELCSFYFPALITRGDLTVSISTGGCLPAGAAFLRQRIEEVLPEETDKILDWACARRQELKEKKIVKAALAAAFSANRPLTEEELQELSDKNR